MDISTWLFYTLMALGVLLLVILLVLALGGPFLVVTYVCTRSYREDRKAAQYWREKWNYGSVNDPDVLVRAAEPLAPSQTLLRAGRQDNDQPEQLLRMATPDTKVK